MPASPCRRHCTLDDEDVCVGCGRTLAEILGWTALDAAGRTAVLESAGRRRESIERRLRGG